MGTTEAQERAEALGLPPELLARLASHYEPEVTDDIIAGYAASRACTLRANTLKASPAEVAAELDAAGIAWRAPAFYADAFVTDAGSEPALRALDAYAQGKVYLQSLSAMLPPLALDPRPGENILDMAAAPGGKTCQTAALSGGKALITACEKNAVRAQKLRHNLEKQGVARCNVMECDARKLDEFFTFDKVLLDAPCSGSGTVSLAGGAYCGGFSGELLERSVKTQRALLRKAFETVRPGGIVVYATCSILPEENELLIESVLNPSKDELAGAPRGGRRGRGRRGRGKRRGGERQRPAKPVNAEVVPLPDGLLEGVPLLPCALEGAACVRPTELYEGFFVAVLKRLS
ncbi:RsmB/NOP family class I SAM-dependent RNA methyltransferase [Adlercreutzia sp. ZJ473]|uniref:RsmB/NOP family class I SAM-dependent RNA methyltransferase n=1 Tax=Adlercreutzia sp. ZJ473 TaxID=2722822 RepID=UPI00155708F7